MIKMSGYPAEYWEKNRCQSIHITVGYHKFPPTQHILRHDWMNESKMRKRPQEATATPHIFFISLLPSLPQEEKLFLMPPPEYHGKKILHQGMSCWTPAQVTFSSVSGRRQRYLLTSTLPLLPHFSSVLHHVYMILQDHLSTVHISTFWFHKW